MLIEAHLVHQHGGLFRFFMCLNLVWTVVGWTALGITCGVTVTVLEQISEPSWVSDLFVIGVVLGIFGVPCACAILTLRGRLPGTSSTKRIEARGFPLTFHGDSDAA